MSSYAIDTNEDFNELKAFLEKDGPHKLIKLNGRTLQVDGLTFEIKDDYIEELSRMSHLSPSLDTSELTDLIFGKDKTDGIVAIEVFEDEVCLFKHDNSIVKLPHKFWVLSPVNFDPRFQRLSGNNYYKYILFFDTSKEKSDFIYKNKKRDLFTVWNDRESAMLLYGFGQFKGMKLEELIVTAFDIETNGVTLDDSSELFLITCCTQKNGKISKKHFSIDEYETSLNMILAFEEYIDQINPEVLTGHNFIKFDIPYLNHIKNRDHGGDLILGRSREPIVFAKKPSQYRVDGNTSWTYNKIYAMGRHLIDGMFLAVKYDIARNYPSWALKAIAAYEGLMDSDRQLYDVSNLSSVWNNPEEKQKIIKYALDDAHDSLKLFYKMVPAYFYISQSIPKPFQTMIEGATGSWVNSILVRGYLQNSESVAKATELTYGVEGGISFAVPGVYKNLVKIDLKSAYPSQILRFKLYNKHKDPKAYFYKMTKFFTEKRFEWKDLYKKTQEKYYSDMEQCGKILINSTYGACNTSGLNYNCPILASRITKETREVINTALLWASGKDKDYWINRFKEKVSK